MNRKLLLTWLLRLVGLIEVLAFIAVIMPRSWMEVSHAWLGLGHMPEGSVLMFLIRQASYTYGMHGITLWILSWDVKRFRPLILFNGVSYLLAAPVFFIIDYTAGMPMWWAAGDSLSCGIVGAAVLWCLSEPPATYEAPTARNVIAWANGPGTVRENQDKR